MKTKFTKNLAASVVAQIIRYGAPLAFYPFLTRSLGAQGFSDFAIMYSAGMIAAQIIEFGFGLAGVREIAEASEHRRSASRIVGEIFAGRAALLCALLISSYLCWQWLPSEVVSSQESFSATIALACGYGFSSSWYFIGRERAAFLSAIEISTSFLQLTLIMSIVRDSNITAAIWAMALPACGAAILGSAISIRDLGVEWPSIARLTQSITQSFRFFCFTGAAPMLGRANLMILAAMSKPEQVAFYAVGERIVSAAMGASLPIVRVVLPRISILQYESPISAYQLFKKSTIALSSLSFLGAILGVIMSPWMIPLVFGGDLAPAVPIIALQLLLIPPMILTRLVGTLAFVPLHRERTYQAIVLTSAASALAIAPFSIWIADAVGLVVSSIIVESIAALTCVFLLRRSTPWRTTDGADE